MNSQTFDNMTTTETALETLSSDRARELSERLLSDGSEVTLWEFLAQLLAEGGAS